MFRNHSLQGSWAPSVVPQIKLCGPLDLTLKSLSGFTIYFLATPTGAQKLLLGLYSGIMPGQAQDTILDAGIKPCSSMYKASALLSVLSFQCHLLILNL